MLLSKQQLKAAQSRQLEKVPLPELATADNPEPYVLIRSLTAGEKDRWEESRLRRRGKSRELNYRYFRASLCALCIVDEDGRPYYSDDEIRELDEMRGSVVDRIYLRAKRLAGVDAEDEDFFSESSGPIPA